MKEMLDVDVMLGVVLVVCVVRVLLLLKAAKRLLVWVRDHGVSVGAKGIVVVLFGGSVCRGVLVVVLCCLGVLCLIGAVLAESMGFLVRGVDSVHGVIGLLVFRVCGDEGGVVLLGERKGVLGL